MSNSEKDIQVSFNSDNIFLEPLTIDELKAIHRLERTAGEMLDKAVDVFSASFLGEMNLR